MSNYSINIQTHAEMFKALGNPHRLAIFQRLTSCCAPGTICEVDAAMHFTVGEIGEDLDIAPSTISHHLKELFRAGLIKTRRNGKNIECWIEPKTLEQLSGFFTLEQNETLTKVQTKRQELEEST
ncbi:MAG: metalloregulator ArsR/SmtB family transcription factor [Cocleimonas sp.]